MSEPTADDLTRSAVLGALAEKAKQKEAPKTVSNFGEVDEKTSFSELLERSLTKRVEASEDSEKVDDETRTRVIKESKVDMIGDLMKRLL